MKLNEFIKQTLIDVTQGVVEAQREALLHIAPGTVESVVVRDPSFVKFEVAVTVSKEAGGGINVWSLGDLKAGAASEQTNRISFEVPVYFQAPTERNERHHSRRDKSKSVEE
ncbi:trypco2 family protein [Frigidibacter mobilis]|uniref:trypco2 family protein n=1 Tax=Frigidibacter mobilis TaxID=1335048 RepID=UPI001412E3B2|nr:trypco2 family protein [Frigidibacter mobilis]